MKVLIEMTKTRQCQTLQHWQANSLYKLFHPSGKTPRKAVSINTPAQAMTPLTRKSTREPATRLSKNPLQ